jgi:hypothetical protein
VSNNVIQAKYDLTPGEYSLYAVYQNEQDNPAGNESVWKGTIPSNNITFRVT